MKNFSGSSAYILYQQHTQKEKSSQFSQALATTAAAAPAQGPSPPLVWGTLDSTCNTTKRARSGTSFMNRPPLPSIRVQQILGRLLLWRGSVNLLSSRFGGEGGMATARGGGRLHSQGRGYGCLVMKWNRCPIPTTLREEIKPQVRVEHFKNSAWKQYHTKHLIWNKDIAYDSTSLIYHIWYRSGKICNILYNNQLIVSNISTTL